MNKLQLLFVACLVSTMLSANNIQVSNISVQNRNTTTKTTMVHFDVSWENSWRTSTLESNWDAAWVFVKFKKKGSPDWQHATLATSGNTGPAGCSIDTVNDGKGVFIKASGNMALSNVNYQGIELKWKYGTDGLLDQDSAEMCVYAIEMVYVPQGSFYLGDLISAYGSNGSYCSIGNPNAYNITSENTITNLAGANAIGDIPGVYSGSPVTIPATYPKGYNGFYCMKYEISQGQYTAFLNKLTSVQATNRFPNQNGINRHTISGAWPNYTTSMPHVACNFINYMDGGAYADWAGLRPMSEMEFEKACRGPLSPVPYEYAWGNTSYIQPASGTITNNGLANETVVGANTNMGGGAGGPLRCGWAGSMPATRQNTGCTFYGIANMSDNLFEMVVAADNTNGRLLDGSDHGNGALTANGDHDEPTWSTNAAAYVRRGAAWFSFSATGVSFRNGTTATSTRFSWEGFRCVRTY